MLEWMAVVFVSILVHELGHGLAFRHFAQEPRVALTAWAAPPTARRRSRTAARTSSPASPGPSPGFVLLGVPAYLLRQAIDSDTSRLLATTIRDLYWVSFVWSLVNLAPVLPLDGGHITQALWGRPVARRLSVVAAVVLTIYLFSSGYGLVLLPDPRRPLGASRSGSSTARAPRPGSPSCRRRPASGAAATAGATTAPPPTGRRRRQATAPSPSPCRPARPSSAPTSPSCPTPPRSSPGRGPGAGRPRAGRDGRVAGGPRRRRRRGPPRAGQGPRRRDGRPVPAAQRRPARRRPRPGRRRLRRRLRRQARRPVRPPAGDAARPHGQAVEVAERVLATEGAGAAFAVERAPEPPPRSRALRNSANVGERLHADTRANRAQVAFEVACAWSRAERPDLALQWIGQAIDDGFTAGSVLDGEKRPRRHPARPRLGRGPRPASARPNSAPARQTSRPGGEALEVDSEPAGRQCAGRLVRRRLHGRRPGEHPPSALLGRHGEAGRRVHRVADHGVLQAGLGADVAGHGVAGRHADAGVEVGLARPAAGAGRPARRAPSAAPGRRGRAGRRARRTRTAPRRPRTCRATPPRRRSRDHGGEEAVEEGHDLLGRAPAGQLRGAPQVDEQALTHRTSPPSSDALLQRLAGDGGADVAAEQVLDPLPLAQAGAPSRSRRPAAARARRRRRPPRRRRGRRRRPGCRASRTRASGREIERAAITMMRTRPPAR